MNGMSDMSAKIYLATQLIAGQADREATEVDMNVKAFSLKEIDQMILNGQIWDSGTMVALYYFKLQTKK